MEHVAKHMNYVAALHVALEKGLSTEQIRAIGVRLGPSEVYTAWPIRIEQLDVEWQQITQQARHMTSKERMQSHVLAVTISGSLHV